MNGDLISREALKEEIRNNKKVAGRFIEGVIMLIDNAPTVDITEEQAIDKLHKTGWLPMHDKEMTERPQGIFVEMLKDRIEKSVCKYCYMNKHCELCEISRVFSIIDLTNKEMKGGADNENKA